MPEKKEIEIRSEEVQDILSKVPHWMIRWGNSVFLLLICMILFLAWLIKYPEVIIGEARITTEIPPYYIVNRVSGNIEKLTKDTLVEQGEFLIEIQSNTDLTNINQLKKELGKAEKIIKNDNAYQTLNADIQVGDAQNVYAQLISSITEYQNFLSDSYYSSKIATLRNQIGNHNQFDSIYNQEQAISKEDLRLAKEKLNMHKELYKEKLISRNELIQVEQSYQQFLKSYESSKRSAVQNEITVTDYERQIRDLRFEQQNKQKQLERQVSSTIINLRSLIEKWNERYVLEAPVTGRVSFFQRLQEGEFVAVNDTIMAIVPPQNKYLTEVYIPAINFGKVEVGQQVQIELLNYPQQEFGYLSGEIKKISAVPRRFSYFAIVELNNGLISNYGKEFEYNPNMTGSARIITKDVTILQRILHRLNKLTTR